MKEFIYSPFQICRTTGKGTGFQLTLEEASVKFGKDWNDILDEIDWNGSAVIVDHPAVEAYCKECWKFFNNPNNPCECE